MSQNSQNHGVADFVFAHRVTSSYHGEVVKTNISMFLVMGAQRDPLKVKVFKK